VLNRLKGSVQVPVIGRRVEASKADLGRRTQKVAGIDTKGYDQFDRLRGIRPAHAPDEPAVLRVARTTDRPQKERVVGRVELSRRKVFDLA